MMWRATTRYALLCALFLVPTTECPNHGRFHWTSPPWARRGPAGGSTGTPTAAPFEMDVKVIGAGLGKTATTSLGLALQRLYGRGAYKFPSAVDNFALDAIHDAWDLGNGGQNPDLRRLLEHRNTSYAAVLDYPLCLHFQKLMAAYPRAKVILTVRDSLKWFRAWDRQVKKIRWNIARRKDEGGPEIHTWPVAWTSLVQGPVGDGFFGGQPLNQSRAIKRYEAWNAHVVKTVPPSRLLVLDIPALTARVASTVASRKSRFRVGISGKYDGAKPALGAAGATVGAMFTAGVELARRPAGNPSAWQRLGEFLGVPVPPAGTPFPKSNGINWSPQGTPAVPPSCVWHAFPAREWEPAQRRTFSVGDTEFAGVAAERDCRALCAQSDHCAAYSWGLAAPATTWSRRCFLHTELVLSDNPAPSGFEASTATASCHPRHWRGWIGVITPNATDGRDTPGISFQAATAPIPSCVARECGAGAWLARM